MFTIENPSQRSDAELSQLANEVRGVGDNLQDKSLIQAAHEASQSIKCILACRSRGEPDCKACVLALKPLKYRNAARRTEEIVGRGEWCKGFEDLIAGSDDRGNTNKSPTRQQWRAVEQSRIKGRKR